MAGKISRILSAFILYLLLVPATQELLGQSYGCYTPWTTKVTFNGTTQNGTYYPVYYSNGQVGLIAFNGKLVLTWGEESTNIFHSMISTNGTTWTNHAQWSGQPSDLLHDKPK